VTLALSRVALDFVETRRRIRRRVERGVAVLRDMLERDEAPPALVADRAPLPRWLVPLESAEGEALLAGAVSRSHAVVAPHFRAQSHANACGVAAALIAMSAMGISRTERDLFTREVRAVRTRREVKRAGMALAHLHGVLELHGVPGRLGYADAVTADAFRAEAAGAVAEGRVLIVNYQRAALGQERIGHLSPLTAYNAAADMALVLDTAAHRYPAHWVPVRRLHEAMAELVRPGGPTRGYFVARDLPPPVVPDGAR
jgi:hypothetical protein